MRRGAVWAPAPAPDPRRGDLAIDEGTTLRVHCLHDALKSEGTKVTKAHVV